MNSKDDLNIDELDDGSIEVHVEDEDELLSQPQAKKQDTQNGFDLAGDDGDDDDDDREGIRAARREERRLKKEVRRNKETESKHLINSLRRQNEELAVRLAQIEQRTNGFQFAQVDKALDDEATRIQYAKMKFQEAIAAGDGETAQQAQDLLFEAKQKHAMLSNAKKQAAQTARQPRRNLPDPRVQNYAAQWVERNAWYDPTLRDTDSKVTRQLDEAMAEEGWDPSTEEYWDELDNRIRKYIPHKAKKGGAKPRGSVGSARDSASAPAAGASSTVYKLSPERVKALKDAGKWDNIQERNKMIRKFAEYDKASR